MNSLMVNSLQTSLDVLTMAPLRVDYLHRRKQPFPALTTKNRPLLCTEKVVRMTCTIVRLSTLKLHA